MPRLIVRTQSAHGPHTRYRAGLGPFGREPVTVEVTPEQAEALRADPVLLVAEAGGESAPPVVPEAAARKRKG